MPCMYMHTQYLHVLTVLLGFYLLTEEQCNIAEPDRHGGCGGVGVNEKNCLDMGCCWDDTDPDPSKHCYFKKGVGTN